MFFRQARSCALRVALVATLVLYYALPSAAATTTLTGNVVTAAGAPVSGASITITGANITLHATTDDKGRFAFPGLGVGTYSVLAAQGELRGETTVDLTSTGASITIAIQTLKEIGRTTSSASQTAQRAVVRGSGTDLSLNASVLARSPSTGSVPEVLVQLPAAARGANGVIHINGDHGDINYIVDGVPLPQELNRQIGSEVDFSNVAFVDVLEGAYPAQYGERFAAIVNINTKAGTGQPGFDLDTEAGSYADWDSTLAYHAKIGAGSLELSSRQGITGRAIDPPNFDSPHNNGSSTNQFLRYSAPVGTSNYINFSVSHSFATYQIPNDVAAGEPATTDDSETQGDTFAALQFRHLIGDRGSISFGPSFKNSRIRDFGDPENDWIFGINTNLANGGTPTDCYNALTISNYSTTTCAYSLFGDSVAKDYAFNVDYDLRSPAHDIKWGALYDTTLVSKNYNIELQPGNFLSPMFTPSTPLAPYDVTDTAPNVGHTEIGYLQDSWKMGENYEFDYGVRFDAFQLFSSQFDQGFSQFSPRLKFTRFFGPRASIYAYYGRFFTPFSFQNVSPQTAYLLNLPLQTTPASFDLLPQRDSDYEIGGHLPIGSSTLGLRVMQKNATDLIDDTQVGNTNLHQDINYKLGRIAVQSGLYQQALPLGGRVYTSISHAYSVNKGCETQLLAPCFGSPTDWTPADHDQRWDITSGVLINDRHHGWASFSTEYGSGLSSTYCQPASDDCKVPPHTTFDIGKGIPIGTKATLSLRVLNFLNDRYLITYLNAQGNHYSAGRVFLVGVNFGRQ